MSNLPTFKKDSKDEKQPSFWRLGVAFLIITFFSHWLYTATKNCSQDEEIVSFYASQTIKPTKISAIEPMKDNYLVCKPLVEFEFKSVDLTNSCGLTDRDIIRYAPLNGYYRRYMHSQFDCNIPLAIKDTLINHDSPISPAVTKSHDTILQNIPYSKSRVGYFLALIIDSEHTAEWSFKQIVTVVNFLSPNDVYLSIFDNGYTDNLRDITTEIRDFIKRMNIANFHVMLSPKRKPDMHFLDLDSFNFNDMMEPFYHFYMDPDSKPYGTDHVYMKPEQWTELKNIRLPPVIDRVVLIKNQYLCASQILELIYTSFVQQSDITTPMQTKLSKSLSLGDNWVFRDVLGQSSNDPNAVIHPLTIERIGMNLPVQVMCSWGEMAVLNPKAFLTSGVRFRRGKNQVKTDQKRAGECSTDIMFTMCMDFIKYGYDKHIMVPYVKTSADKDAFMHGISKSTMNEKNDEKIEYVELGKKVKCEPLYEDTKVLNEDSYENEVP
eukprot:NODE_715_length_4836_cov_0.118640.p1 type:complete len:493 gc:universal NODE_715_length_4836_cov_0.118640:3239-4717(+)